MFTRLRDLAHAGWSFLKAPLGGKLLIAEACGRMAWAMVAVRRHGFAGTAEGLGNGLPANAVAPTPVSSEQATEALRVGRVVGRAARMLGGPDTCFPQALAATAMLQRRNISSTALIGVRRDEEGELESHAWVHAGDVAIVGGAGAGRYTPMAAYVATPVASRA